MTRSNSLAAEARAALEQAMQEAASAIHREATFRTRVHDATKDDGLALEGAAWAVAIIAATFPTGDASQPDHDAAAGAVAKEILGRMWRAALPISKRLYAAMRWRRTGGAWRERPSAKEEPFYFARGWALAEAYSLDLTKLVLAAHPDIPQQGEDQAHQEGA